MNYKNEDLRDIVGYAFVDFFYCSNTRSWAFKNS